MQSKHLSRTQGKELLDYLKGYPFLARHNLYLFQGEAGEKNVWRFRPAGSVICQELDERLWLDVLPNALQTAAAENRPVVTSCRTGLLLFALPVMVSGSFCSCLVGIGTRKENFDLWQLEGIARTTGTNPFSLLADLEKLPIATLGQVKETAEKVLGIIGTIPGYCRETLPPERARQRLATIVGISEELDATRNLDEVIALLSETIGILFNVPKIALALADRKDSDFRVRGIWGLPAQLGRVPRADLALLVPQDSTEASPLSGEQLRDIFPLVDAGDPIPLPLRIGPDLLGVVLLYQIKLTREDLLQVRLVTGRAALKIMQLRREEELTLESSLARRILTMISALSFTNNTDELYRSILDMAGNLLRASSGSLMLLNDSGEELRIEAVKGMNLKLARNLSMKVGTGIAGRVLKNGQPMLVNDIEQDSRTGFPNRPRFKTKSFISMPLQLKGSVIGVLNLSDKENHEIFTDEDLRLLSSFVSHAMVLIERARTLERTSLLEELSVTDPLTELYNRRFLAKRLDEELSRCERQEEPFTLMLIDLDNFKGYNDLCGHVAGDRVLRRTAQILRNSVREMDIITRYGGEEFCIILPGTTKKESLFVAERIRHGIEQEAFPEEQHLPAGCLTASLGIASFPDDGRTPTSLINAADIALYQAKADGKNRIALFQPAVKASSAPTPLPQTDSSERRS